MKLQYSERLSLEMMRVGSDDSLCCRNYVAPVMDKLISLQHWWNDADGEKTEVLQ